MEKVVESEDVDYLPHGPETLASNVLFSLRVGDVVDLNKWLPQAKLRPHVVLKLLCALVDSKYRFGSGVQDATALKSKFETLVQLRYPDTETHLLEIGEEAFHTVMVNFNMKMAINILDGSKKEL